MYDATIGRFFSADPIGLDGGDASFYRYLKNDPANAIDPSGLETSWEWYPLGWYRVATLRSGNSTPINRSAIRCHQQPKPTSSGRCDLPSGLATPRNASDGGQLWAEFSTLLGRFDPKALDRFNKPWFLGLSRETQLEYIRYLKEWEDYNKKQAARAEERAARDRLPKIGALDRSNPYCSFNDRWAGKEINRV